MNPDLLLSASDKDLPRMLGEALQPEVCHRCGVFYDGKCNARGRVDTCNEIPLTPANAFKFWKLSIKNYGVEAYKDALISVIMPGEENAPNSVKLEMVLLATETDHLKASALCKLNQENSNGK